MCAFERSEKGMEFNMSDSKIIKKEEQSEFFSLREGILNLGRITSYSILLFAGLSRSNIVLNITLMGIILKDIDTYEELEK